MDWTSQLLEQLTFHWDHQARPRLDGLTDDEYFWEPVPGAWNIRPRAEARTGMPGGGGALVADFEYPEPVPAPVTTIAWRLGHVIVGVFGARNAAHFGGPPMDYSSVDWP
ncbi:MAG TPA: DinB family protein, partial [Acidimicrobiia bacterium]